MTGTGTTAVIEVSGVHWASSKAVTEAVLSRRPGVLAVDANPVSQTATVTYDPARTSVAELAGWVRDCGYHCAGQSVPDHVCDPMAEPTALPRGPPRQPRPAGRGSARRPRCGGHDAPTTPARRRRAADLAGRDGARRSPRRDVDGRHGPRHAEPVPRRRGAVGAGAAVVADRPGGVRVHRAGAVRPAGRRVLAAAVAAGDLLLGVDLLRRRLPGAEGPDAGHDGAGRRRGRRRLAVQRRGHPDRLVTGAAATCSTRPQPFSPRSCCSGTGSRCAPAAAPTTRSAPCWSSRRRRRWCCATGRRSRSRPPRSRWATCCWSGRGRRSRSTAWWRPASPRSTSRW